MKAKKLFGWDVFEAKDFVDFLIKNKNMPLTTNFSLWAEKSCRQKYSVRNYFYKLKKLIKDDKNFIKIFNIKDSDVQKVFFRHFKDEDSKKLLFQILPIDGQKSVREACLKLAKNDVCLMLRYQNKYRNIIKNQKDEVIKVMNELKNNNIKTRNPYNKNKIIEMPKAKKVLSDEDIKSLFMGLCKLIKNNVEVDVQNKEQTKKVDYNQKLKLALIQNRRKDFLIEELKNENQKLKEEFKILEKNLFNLKTNIKSTDELKNSDKMKKLKQFFDLNIDLKKGLNKDFEN
ncbi:MAG: hypothetical protein IJ837_02020 [Clostridia bacterium]|nr:hypothetical protein [Clostridia bacterium]